MGKKKSLTPDEERRKWIIASVRRASYRWVPRYKAKAAARIERGQYKCAACKGLFGPKQISLDHIKPVVDPHKGFIDWNNYIERLFCEEDGFQVLCKTCHSAKSKHENAIRRIVKKEKTKKK